uniref:Peroxisomal hydratase-dehydrogenase-epimerase n=1 Tax=Ganoderma boninense TaxID=34458 RepID=A0A5K1JZN0_9APHY|nr:Peroxisomal hydratase-dehydrogenase-epimerase [Ganoderma boninense]
MKLTYDVLLHIISLFPYAENAVHLMATCRVLYHAGAKIALRKPIIIKNSEQLTSFLQFLRAENLSRCQYLKNLELGTCGKDEDEIHDLLDTIPRLVNIECLSLSHAEDVLEPDRALPAAFATLKTLRYLQLPGVVTAGVTLLSLLRSPLTSADIDFTSADGSDVWSHLDPDQLAEFHPVTLLQNFAATLEELCCGEWSTVIEPDIPKIPIYPKMRKLALEHHDSRLRMDPFIQAFPNLTHLHVCPDYYDRVAEFDMENIRESHGINVEKQLASGVGRWAHLEHFSGGLADFYATGLACPIRRVTITGIHLVEHEPATEMLATMFRCAQPVHLKLEGLSSSMLEDFDRSFLAMLRGEGASNLVNLAVSIRFDARDRERDLRDTIVRLYSPRVPLGLG